MSFGLIQAALSTGEVLGGMACAATGYGLKEAFDWMFDNESRPIVEQVEDKVNLAKSNIEESHQVIPMQVHLKEREELFSHIKLLDQELKQKKQVYDEFAADSLSNIPLINKDLERYTQAYLKLKNGIKLLEDEMIKLESKDNISGSDLKRKAMIIDLLTKLDVKNIEVGNEVNKSTGVTI